MGDPILAIKKAQTSPASSALGLVGAGSRSRSDDILHAARKSPVYNQIRARDIGSGWAR